MIVCILLMRGVLGSKWRLSGNFIQLFVWSVSSLDLQRHNDIQ